MKDTVWKVLVFLTSMIPRGVRSLLCRLLFAACARGDVSLASRVLLTLSTELNWHINEVAVRYGNGIHPKHRLTGYHEYFTSRLNMGEPVLDIGCGYGALADSMARAGAVVIGVDISKKSIEQAKSSYQREHLTFLAADIHDVTMPRDVDTVVLSNVLEHIDERIRLLERIITNVAPKRFLIRVPMLNRDWQVLFRKELGVPYFSDPTHFTEYTTQSFHREMEQAGLEIKEYEIMWGELYAEAIPSKERFFNC